MKILKIWDADYPWDIRVEKICRALSHQNHEVHLLCRNLRKLPSYEQWEYGYIHRLPAYSSQITNSFFSFPAFFSPLWLKAAYKIIRKYDIDLIMVRDLPLTLAAVAIGRISHLPVIFDMAENYYFLIKDIWRYEPLRFINALVRNPLLVKLVERISFKTVNHILVVVEESKERLINKGVPERKITVVSNTPDLRSMTDISPGFDYSAKEIFNNRYVILYVGGLEFARGLDQLFDALPSVIKKAPDLLFVVVGHGNSEKRLKKKALDLNLTKHVCFTGWLQHDYMISLIKHSDVGIVPHYITEHTNHTIPNKLFDYMSQGLPVITSDAKPMNRIITLEQCGYTFRNNDELINSLVKLRNMSLRKRMGQRGKQAIIRRYNWEYDSLRLAQAISRFNDFNVSAARNKRKQFNHGKP